MPEAKAIEPAYRRHDFSKMPEAKARPSGDKTWVKFGKEQEIQDFINAGVEQCSIIKHIEDAGGLEKLRAAGIKDIDETVIDRGMDIVTMNRISKIMNIELKKMEAKKIAEEQAKQNKDKGE